MDVVVIAGLLGGVCIILMFIGMGLPADIMAMDDAQRAQAPERLPDTQRVYVYTVDGEYTIDDAPVALLEARYDA